MHIEMAQKMIVCFRSIMPKSPEILVGMVNGERFLLVPSDRNIQVVHFDWSDRLDSRNLLFHLDKSVRCPLFTYEGNSEKE